MKLIKWVIKNVETLVKRMESINMTQIYWGLIVLFLFLVYNIESIKIISILVVIIWCYLFLRKSILRISLTKRVEYQNLYKENKEKNLIKENEELIKKVRKIFKIINFLNNIKVKFILLFYLFAFQKWMYRFFSWFNVKLINYPRIRVSVFVIFACIIYYPVIMIFYFYYKFWFKLIGLNFKILILKRLMELIIIMQILLFLYQYISLFWLIYIILVILSILQFVYEEYFFQTFKTAFYLNNHKNKVIRWIYRKFINDFFNLINCHLILSMKLSIGIFDCLIYSWISLLYDGFDKQIIDKDVYNILKEEQWRLGLDLIKEINIFFFFFNSNLSKQYLWLKYNFFYEHLLYNVIWSLGKNYISKVYKDKPIFWVCFYFEYGNVSSLTYIVLGLYLFKNDEKKKKELLKFLEEVKKKLIPYYYFYWNVEKYYGIKKSFFRAKIIEEERESHGSQFISINPKFCYPNESIFDVKKFYREISIEKNNDKFPDLLRDKKFYNILVYNFYKKDNDSFWKNLEDYFNNNYGYEFYNLDIFMWTFCNEKEAYLVLEEVNKLLDSWKKEWEEEWKSGKIDYYLVLNKIKKENKKI